MIKQMGGQITVSSELMRGTEFRIHFPRKSAPEARWEVQAPIRSTAVGLKTLPLVEDEEVVRAMLVEVLKEEGYPVLEAAHGEEALQTARAYEGPIDLLVTDLTMPHMGGRELASRLVAYRPQLRVLFVSGHSDASIGRHGDPAFAANFLQKPFRPNVLLENVCAILAV